MDYEHPHLSRYRCRLCYKYFDEMHLPKQSKPMLAFEKGSLYDTYKKNQEVINDLAKSISHTNIISNLQAKASKKQRSSYFQDEQAEEKKDNKFLEITARMIRSVYALNKLSLPFSDHQHLITLQKLNGLNMGYHHFERTSCARMTIDISNHMHITLIDNLITSNLINN